MLKSRISLWNSTLGKISSGKEMIEVIGGHSSLSHAYRFESWEQFKRSPIGAKSTMGVLGGTTSRILRRNSCGSKRRLDPSPELKGGLQSTRSQSIRSGHRKKSLPFLISQERILRPFQVLVSTPLPAQGSSIVFTAYFGLISSFQDFLY